MGLQGPRARQLTHSARGPVFDPELRYARKFCGVMGDQGKVVRKRDRRNQEIALSDRSVAQEVSNPCVLLCSLTAERDHQEGLDHRSPRLAFPCWGDALLGSIPQLGDRDAGHGNVVGALPLEVRTDTRRAAETA